MVVESIERFLEDHAFSPLYNLAPPPPPFPLSPVIKVSLFLRLSVSLVELADGGGGGVLEPNHIKRGKPGPL
jgi:hypothetical protein